MALNKSVCTPDGPQLATIAGSLKELWFKIMFNGQMRRTLECSVASHAMPFGTRTATTPQQSVSETSRTPQPSPTTRNHGIAMAGKMLTNGGSNTKKTTNFLITQSNTNQYLTTRTPRCHPKPVELTPLSTA